MLAVCGLRWVGRELPGLLFPVAKLGSTSNTSSRMCIQLGNGLLLENPEVNSKLTCELA